MRFPGKKTATKTATKTAPAKKADKKAAVKKTVYDLIQEASITEQQIKVGAAMILKESWRRGQFGYTGPGYNGSNLSIGPVYIVQSISRQGIIIKKNGNKISHLVPAYVLVKAPIEINISRDRTAKIYVDRIAVGCCEVPLAMMKKLVAAVEKEAAAAVEKEAAA